MAQYRCRLEPHGPHQIELKIRYPLSLRRKEQYSLDLYMFVPGQLRVNRETYGHRRFIDDVMSHIRHTSPRIGLPHLVDPDFPDNPLRRVKEALEHLDGEQTSEQILHDLRTLGNAYRAGIRSERSAIRREARRGDCQAIGERVPRISAEVERFLAELRALPPAFERAGVPPRLLTAVRWADEWISLNTEVEAVNMWEAACAAGAGEEAKAELIALARGENAYRRKRGYPSVVNLRNPIGNEKAIHHESLLKKWAQGSMYMSSEQTSTSKGVGHIIAAVAAAAAMTFAVAATFLAQRLFASYSVPWALMIVVGYIFKDRIKEVLRLTLNRFLPLLFYDRAGRLVDPALRDAAGNNRETVRFLTPGDCPSEVVGLRNADGNPFHDILPREDVIHYNKIVKLQTGRLREGHPDMESITEILRIKVDPWMREMDDPVSTMRTLRGDSIVRVTTRRVYHAHLILVMTQAGVTERRRFQHHLLVLSREGVVRIEPVAPQGGVRREPAAPQDIAESSRE